MKTVLKGMRQDLLSLFEFSKNHSLCTLFGIILILLPFIASVPHWVSFPTILSVTTGEFVMFYGTVGAVVWAIAAYALNESGKNNEREKALKPQFVITLHPRTRTEPDTPIVMKFINVGAYGVRDICVYDCLVYPWLASQEEGDEVETCFREGDSCERGVNQSPIVHVPDKIMDAHRFPSEICIKARTIEGIEYQSFYVCSEHENGCLYIYDENRGNEPVSTGSRRSGKSRKAI